MTYLGTHSLLRLHSPLYLQGLEGGLAVPKKERQVSPGWTGRGKLVSTQTSHHQQKFSGKTAKEKILFCTI
jgi:hypothetical protein